MLYAISYHFPEIIICIDRQKSLLTYDVIIILCHSSIPLAHGTMMIMYPALCCFCCDVFVSISFLSKSQTISLLFSMKYIFLLFSGLRVCVYIVHLCVYNNSYRDKQLFLELTMKLLEFICIFIQMYGILVLFEECNFKEFKY